MYFLSYITLSLMLLSCWLCIFYYRPDLRKPMFTVSIFITPMGPMSEYWYNKDYWKPITILGYSTSTYTIGIEDFIFAFALAGITYSLYKIIFRKTNSISIKNLKKKWLIPYFIFIVTSSLLLLTSYLKMNSILSSSIAFIVVSITIWIIRPDLIFPSVLSGLILLFFFIINYSILESIFPGILQFWCNGCNPSGIRIASINIEELFWDFSWGTTGGIIFESINGRRITPL